MDFITFDASYVERLAAGDPVIEQHFNKYFGELIFIKLRSRQYPGHTIDDVRQETFLRVIQVIRRDGLRQPERIGAFVNTVCNHVVMEQNRAGSRVTLMEETPDTADQSVDSETDLIARERRAHVREVLSQMSEKNRKLLTAVFIDERPLDDVCSELSVDRKYLRVLLFRARNQLKEQVKKTGKSRASNARD